MSHSRTMSMVCAVGLLVASIACAGEKVSLRADTWYPYNGDPASDKPGFMIEVAKVIFEKAGYTLDYQTKGWTWDRSIEEARKGAIDGIVGAAKEDAPDFIFPEEPMILQRMSFFVKKGNPWRYKGVESLKSVKLGIISGYSYDGVIDAYVNDNKDKETAIQALQDDNALELNLKKLQAGRIDVVIEDPAVLRLKASELGIADQFEQAGVSDDPKPQSIAFSPAKESSKKIAKILSDGIKDMRASGELQKLMAKYDLVDTSAKK